MATEVCKQEPLTNQVCRQNKITDLLVRFWGLGRELDSDERDTLLAALDEENKFIGGPIHLRALERLKEQGIE
jgi:hypothetical protein